MVFKHPVLIHPVHHTSFDHLLTPVYHIFSDWNTLGSKVPKRLIEGKRMKFSRIPLTHSICVWKPPSMITLESFREYFSNPKSGNKHEKRVTGVKIEDHVVVVTFEDNSGELIQY